MKICGISNLGVIISYIWNISSKSKYESPLF
jgi:hypothetical protein